MIAKNNPLNIRAGRNNWKGQIGVTKGFCVFDSVESCIRAWLYLVFISYPRVLGFDMTISQFINRYCPAGDGSNDPDLYVTFVCSSTNRFKPYSIVLFLDKQALFTLCYQMCLIETHYSLSYKIFNSVYEEFTFVENRS